MTEARDTRDVALRGTLAAWRGTGARRWIGLSGVSMRPLIAAGGSALVDFGMRTPRVGDVVLAEAGGRLVVHRVVAAPVPRRPSRWILKGDAEPYADPAVGADDIYGTVLAVRSADGEPERRAGLSGAHARSIAVVSRLATRALRFAAVPTALLPHALRRPTGRGLALLARLPVLIVAITPLPGGKIAIHAKGGDS